MTEEELAAKFVCAEIERVGLDYYVQNNMPKPQAGVLVENAKALARFFFGR